MSGDPAGLSLRANAHRARRMRRNDMVAFVSGVPLRGASFRAGKGVLCERTEWRRRRRACVGRRRVVWIGSIADEVKERLSSADFVERLKAATQLGSTEVVSDKAGTSERVKALLPLCGDDAHPQVRFCALGALAAQSGEHLDDALRATTLETCRRILNTDKEPNVRCGAADAIAGLRLSEGFDDLIAAYDATTDWMLRLSVVAGLGEMRHARAFDFLSSIVSTTGALHEAAAAEPLVLAAAVGALGDLGDERGLSLVSKLAGNSSVDEHVRERAAIAVDMLSK